MPPKLSDAPCGKALARRRGAAAVEFVIVFGVFLAIVLAFLDLSVMLLRRNALADAARRVARRAMTHGSLSAPESQRWGPAAYAGTAAASSPIAEAARPSLVAVDYAQTRIRVQWPDGGNRPGQRVQVLITYPHQPLLPFLWGEASSELRGASVMQIAH
jgi:Flp pilus assembly protein TadG